ncbi:hypothetical protein RRG08_043961 [Elysia crispata]|uniref:Uncharacterized protein n=1 Tax=Elysia crispata TaxID=231223 RepID=A0AAE0Y0R6_9GAST|nr:hypothetical protein RRG08_043961 [Elysia crispata]
MASPSTCYCQLNKNQINQFLHSAYIIQSFQDQQLDLMANRRLETKVRLHRYSCQYSRTNVILSGKIRFKLSLDSQWSANGLPGGNRNPLL